MYLWLWRHLPPPTALRVALVLLLVAGAVALLMGLVFPWFDTVVSTDLPTLD